MGDKGGQAEAAILLRQGFAGQAAGGDAADDIPALQNGLGRARVSWS
jgi:hypothetical protein